MFDKQRQDDLQLHKLEALGHFAGGIAHDFNNILSVIEGYATRGLRLAAKGDIPVDVLQKILLSTERGAGLTRQLLAFARQNLDLNASIEFGAEINRLQVLLEPLLSENITLVLPQVSSPLYVRLSVDRLTQIFLNLAVNARDAMCGHGEIRITVRQVQCAEVPGSFRPRVMESAYARISVCDNGCGISAEELPHIFDPFFTTKRQQENAGTGLGLSVVYGIVDQAGGFLDVRTQVGEGTCFDIYLPLAATPEVTLLDTNIYGNRQLAGRTILLAEDEPELRDVLSVMLQDMELKVLPAANGNEAMRLQDTYDGEIDFLLTDIVMPGINGVQLSDLFIAERPDANVVLMSGYPFLESGRPLPVPEGTDFIAKPFRGNKIREILERALTRKATRLQRESQDDTGPNLTA